MTKTNELYKCEVCDNVVLVVEGHDVPLVCCGQEMKQMEEQTIAKEGKEKHVPIIEIDGKNVKVKVGSVPHPMEESHWIEFIQILKDGKIIAHKQLSPGEKPEAEFCLDDTEGIVARELCNIHGLWKN